jgi:hypothetical protein
MPWEIVEEEPIIKTTEELFGRKKKPKGHWEFEEVKEPIIKTTKELFGKEEKPRGHWEVVQEEKDILKSLGVGLPEEKDKNQDETSILNSMGVGLLKQKGRWIFEPVEEGKEPKGHWQIVEEPSKISPLKIGLETLGQTAKDIFREGVIGPLEAAGQLTSGLLSFPVHLAAKLGIKTISGKSWVEAEQEARKVSSLIPSPEITTESGKLISEVAGAPFAGLGWIREQIPKAMGVQDEPETSEALKTMFDIGIFTIPSIKRAVISEAGFIKGKLFKEAIKSTPEIPEQIKTIVDKIPDEQTVDLRPAAERIKAKTISAETFKGEQAYKERVHAPIAKTEEQLAQEAFQEKIRQETYGEPTAKGVRIEKGYPPEYIAEQNRILAEQEKIVQAEAEILKRTGKTEAEINQFIKNDFMDGEKLRDTTKNVMAGKIDLDSAAKDIAGWIDATTGKAGERGIRVPTTVEEIAQRKALLEEQAKIVAEKGALTPAADAETSIRRYLEGKTPQEQSDLLTERKQYVVHEIKWEEDARTLSELFKEEDAINKLLKEIDTTGKILPAKEIGMGEITPEEMTGTRTINEITRLEKEEKEKGTLPGIGLSIEQQAGPKVKGKFEFKDPEIEKRFETAKGIPKKTLPQRVIDSFITLKNKATRTYENLPNKAQFIEAKTALKTLAKQSPVTSYKTLRILHDITLDLDKESLNQFRRKVILADLYQEARKGHDLPFGFTAESIVDELKRIDTAIEKSPEIKDALAKRERVWKAVKDDYVFWADKAGFEVEDRLKRADYYRHQILEYARAKGVATTGKRLRTPTGRGFLKGRAGSEYDINTDYFEAEHEILGQMLYDTEVMKTIDRLRKNYDISAQVKKGAKEKRLLDWRENVPQGYAAWQPREGNVFYQTDTIPARVAEQILEGELTDLDVVKEKLNKSLAVGQKRAEWVIPTELAKTLDNLKGERPNWLTKLSSKALRGWKVWTLISPRRVFKYNIRNLSGDADAVFVGNPSAFRKVPVAMKELYDVLVLNKPMSENMKTWFERGGVETTLQAQELGDIKALRLFQRFYDQKGNLKSLPEKTWKAYWKTARLGTDFRESILRYASFLDYKEQVLSSAEGRPRNFGGSLPQEIMALKDPNDKAFRLSNELLGPYDEISELGQVIRKHVFPFWSWQELNFRRYVRFFKNAARDNAVCSTIGRKLLATGLKTPYLILRTGRFALKAAALWGMLQAYNQLKFPEEEEDLPTEVKGRPHIILGRGKDGKVKYFSRVGALGDFLDWFGLDDLPNKISSLVNGKKSLKDTAIEMAESPVNKFAQGLNPFLKTPMELITRRAIFPDISNPKTIRDRGEYLAKTLGLENEYREIAGKPARPYSESLPQAIIYETDPLESAYYEIQDKKREFLKKFGKAGEGFWLSPRGNALFNMKLAHRYKDKVAAEKYLRQYLHYHALEFEAGTKNEKELAASVKQGILQAIFSMYPLYGLSAKEQLKFIVGLDEDEKKTLAKALRFYSETLIGATNTEQK